jgi:transcriptional regulator with XRE-family HTH domain
VKKFSENLKSLRKTTKTQQNKIAAALGIPLRTYQAYEYAEFEPGLATLVALADFYDITIDELVGRVRENR